MNVDEEKEMKRKKGGCLGRAEKNNQMNGHGYFKFS